MRILFVMASPEYLRYYDSTIRLLAERGHTVFVGVNKYSKNQQKSARLESIADGTGRIAVAGLLPHRDDTWQMIARRLRGTMDYVRFLDPRFKDTPFLRQRMRRKVLPASLQPLANLSTLPRPLVWGIIRVLETLERAIPSSRKIEAFLRSLMIDAVIVTPLVDAASDQVDYIKSAKALGLRSAAGIASWDNLTNKGLLRIQPDMVLVWNEIQRKEAVELHGADPSSVVVTGAQLFDRWFGRTPTLPREEFCTTVGLGSDRPFVLFVGSTAFISSPHAEVEFVRKWLQALRASPHQDVRTLGVLVRPHPYNCEQWRNVDLSALGHVTVWPRAGANPVDEADRAAYFDSLYHSVAVVGINTSAMIEAAIIGRPVHTILAPEFKATQRGTVHFKYLMPEHGGFVRVASGFAEHIEHLRESIHSADAPARPDKFLRSFVRPFGLDTPCTPAIAAAIERLAGQERGRLQRVPLWLWPLTGVQWLASLLIGRNRPKISGSARAVGMNRADSTLRILLLTGHFALLRNFESVIETLANRGHRVRLVADADEIVSGKRERLGGKQLVERLTEENPLISTGLTPDRKVDRWADTATWIRLSIDYLRYTGPAYKDAAMIVARAEHRTPPIILWLSRLPLLKSRHGLAFMAWALGLLERSLPISRVIEKFYLREQPDIVLITPLLNLGSAQYDYLRCAKRLGLRTALCVTSWDHLSSKALIRDHPDLVLVWNEIQKAEAMDMHGVPPERIVVTGAQCYDHWFAWRASTSREEFCERIGLSPHKPYILYVCSAIFKGTGNELAFIRSWIRRLRDLGQGELKEAGILIRPHPGRVDEWAKADLSGLQNVAVWPRDGANPIDSATKADYYDSMYHSTAIVGINTSALIEAGIVGRPVYTILAEELAGSQVGTLHFHYLMNVNGGLLHVARTVDESIRMLGDLLAHNRSDSEKNRRFVEAFVRPYGIEVEATPRFVDAVERLARSGRAVRRRAPVWTVPLTALLHAVSLFTPLLRPKDIRTVKTVSKKTARADHAQASRVDNMAETRK